jgi:hypothetical protein
VTEDRGAGHAGDDDLVLDYYGELEAGERERVRDHLAWCADCQRAEQELRSALRLVDVAPAVEAPEGFEHEMWRRIEPHVSPIDRRLATPSTPPGRPSWLSWFEISNWITVPRWTQVAWAGGVAGAVLVAFLAGRAGRPQPAPGDRAGMAESAGTAATRERVLDAEVEDHLERSQRVLTELVNTDMTSPVVLAGDRARAADLVAAGRVYRRSADDLGDMATSELLEDLERVLLDVANGSTEPTPREVRDLRERIGDQDLVFRLRVVAAELRRRQGPGPGMF